MAKPSWFLRLVYVVIPNFRFVARLSHWPVLGKWVDWIFFKGDRAFYLLDDRALLRHEHDGSSRRTFPPSGRRRVEINEPLAHPEDMVVPSKVLEYFVSNTEYRWLMSFCPCRVSSKCRDYDRDFGCIFLGKSVLRINSKWGRLVSKEEALSHVRQVSEKGLIHLIGKNRIDTIWLDAKPGHKLLTICSCCPCCCIWGNLPSTLDDIGGRTTRMPGVFVEVDADACTGCGKCADGVCVFDATLVEEKAVKTHQCRACGKCMSVCPEKAITLRIEDPTFIEETIRRMDEVIDLN